MKITKLPHQPYCRNCARPIRKSTEVVYFGRSANETISQRRPEKPRSIAEVRALFNEQVVSVGWEHRRHSLGYIDKAYLWDGESYVDEFFCTGACAQAFGYIMARRGYSMPEAYVKKMKASHTTAELK
jgi:hypothetical protein